MTITDHDLMRRARELLDAVPPGSADQHTFRGAQYDAGLAWVHFPPSRGGLGIEPRRQVVVDDVLRDAGVDYHDLRVNPMGISLGAPTLLRYGTDEQQARHLRSIFTGKDIWCQLFSEPASGSDLAGLASRAVRDGDQWVINGQKVWTTSAHIAHHGMLIARTDPDVPKHRGLTYFIVDMRSPGVDVRPLYQLTGDAEFNEVFLTDVRVPANNVVGVVGDGWRVATTTLMHERATIGRSSGSPRSGLGQRLLAQWGHRRDGLTEHQRHVMQDQVTRLWIRAELQRLTAERARAAAASGSPGPEGSIGKLMAAELRQAVSATCVDLDGARGTVHEPGYPFTRTAEIGGDPSVTGQFLRSRASTIEGGTSEIMRNILSERLLGLPAEPHVDRDVPWTQVPR